MIKRKTKFVQASFETEELGARNFLMQESPSSLKSAHSTKEKKLSPEQELAIRIMELETHIFVSQFLKDLSEDKRKYLEFEKVKYAELMKQQDIMIQANMAAGRNADGTERKDKISDNAKEVFRIAQEYGFSKDGAHASFLKLMNSEDKDIQARALLLEKDLAKLGYHLKVDGKIDDKTLNTIDDLIIKNERALERYEKTTGNSLIKEKSRE